MTRDEARSLAHIRWSELHPGDQANVRGLAVDDLGGQVTIIYSADDLALYQDERALWSAARPVRCGACGSLRPGRVSADILGRSFLVFLPGELV